MGKTALLSLSRGGADLSALTSLQTAWGLTLCEPDSCSRYTPASGVWLQALGSDPRTACLTSFRPRHSMVMLPSPSACTYTPSRLLNRPERHSSSRVGFGFQLENPVGR